MSSCPFEIEETPGRVVMTLPIKTISEANCFEPWRKRHARHKAQKKAVELAYSQIHSKPQLPCKITLCRLSMRFLDKNDNLPCSFKWILDAVCDNLLPGLKPGRADGDERISVKYDQEKSKEYGVRITMEF